MPMRSLRGTIWRPTVPSTISSDPLAHPPLWGTLNRQNTGALVESGLLESWNHLQAPIGTWDLRICSLLVAIASVTPLNDEGPSSPASHRHGLLVLTPRFHHDYGAGGVSAHIGRCPTQHHIEDAPFAVGANDEEIRLELLCHGYYRPTRLARL